MNQVMQVPFQLQTSLSLPARALFSSLLRQSKGTIESPALIVVLADVSPDLAKSMLDLRPEGQRSISARTVAAYTSDMTFGVWETNGETIKLGPDMSLIDGQHRLAAAVASGFTLVDQVIAICVRSEDAIKTIDIGRRRTLKDLGDITRAANHNLNRQRKAAILWEHSGFNRLVRSGLSPRAQLDIIASTDVAHAVTLIKGDVPAGIIGAFIAAWRKAPDQAVAFFSAALAGRHEIDGKFHASLRYLSNWLIQAKAERRYAGDSFLHESTFRSLTYWNDFRLGRERKMPVKYFGMSDSEIPEAI